MLSGRHECKNALGTHRRDAVPITLDDAIPPLHLIIFLLLVLVGVLLGFVRDGHGAAGLAAKYPSDIGIEKDPSVIFADDFESWKSDGTPRSAGKWSGIITSRAGRSTAVPGKVSLGGSDGPGGRVLEVACWRGAERRGSSRSGVWLKLGNYVPQDKDLGNGYDDVYVRYYVRFASNYKSVRNHGQNLGGRDLTMRRPAWVGQAGIRDVARKGYLYSGLPPRSARRRRRGERGDDRLFWSFYSYHMDKRGPWGDVYAIPQKETIEIDRWYCVERHMKLNSVEPVKADALEELWVDGKLVIRKEGLRFRKVPTLRITFFSLGTYYHGLPAEYDRQKPIKVYFDNVVIAKKRIGGMTLAKK